MKRFCLLSAFIIPVLFFSCNHVEKKHGPPFGLVKGTRFTEVRRAFNTGLVFDKQGYQLEPLWKLYFVSDDSVMVFSPTTKKYYGYHIYLDPDSIFNMVDSWLLLKKIDKDSLVFRALRVEDRRIKDKDEGSNVFLTFYSDQYLKRCNNKKIQAMGLPGPKDTLFIKAKAKLASSNMDSAFSAKTPVILKSTSPMVKVEKVVSVSTPINKIEPSMDYLHPEYNITIHKSYEDFSYIFTAFVDDKGQIYFEESMIPYMPEFRKTYKQVIQGIIDGYLKHYLAVTPGTTLGIAHTSSILLNVVGKKK
jgi:hypothetical protein